MPVLYRPSKGGPGAGVAAALSQLWHVDAQLVRIGFVLATLLGGLGAVFYIACIVALPREGQQYSQLQRLAPAAQSWTAGRLVVAAAAAAVAVDLAFNRSWFTLMLLAGLWFVFRHRGGSGPSTRTSDFRVQSDAWAQRVAEYQADSSAVQRSLTPDPTFTPPPTPDDVPAAPRSPAPAPLAAFAAGHTWNVLPQPPGATSVPVSDRRRAAGPNPWLLTLVVVAACLTATAIADALVGVPPATWSAAALLGVGLSCICLAFLPRHPRFLLVVGVLLSLATLSMAVPTSDADIRLSYTSLASVPSEQHYAAGRVEVDLSAITITDDRTIEVGLGVGELVVKLPTQGAVCVASRARVGEIELFGSQSDGLGVTANDCLGAGDAVLHLNLNVAVGSIAVTR